VRKAWPLSRFGQSGQKCEKYLISLDTVSTEAETPETPDICLGSNSKEI